MPDIQKLYDRIAMEYDRDRTRSLMEAPYLERIAANLPAQAAVLDIGCGTGEPIARYFLERGHELVGVDGAAAMIGLCRRRFPATDWKASWIEQDMRALDLHRRFDAILAWDSFFHLTAEDQRAMFEVFARHAAPRTFLLFTSGPRAGIALGDLYGEELFHASLDAEEYAALLARHGFDILLHRVEDPDCGRHTVWLAQRRG